jgi:gamma-glutamyltranspeptidase/glutathione hydrolase
MFRAVLLLMLLGSLSRAAETPSVEGKKGVVVCVSAPATEAGIKIFNQGGNAVDATVAVALAMAVTYPPAGNIGGGGFMLVLPPGAKEPLFYEYRETAPASVNRETFLKETSVLTHKAVGVPGTLRGMELAHKKHGKLKWKEVVEPAITFARDGFILSDHLARSLNQILRTTKEKPEFMRVFSRPDGQPWKAGDRLVQPDLAKTMQRIADEGPDAFYTGKIAEQLVEEMKSGGGFITLEDLKKYEAKERKPIHGTYRGYDLFGPSPPSGGGMCLVEMLNILEGFDLKKHPKNSPETIHLLIETMKRGYADRARYLGDPAFTEIPAKLTSKEYAAELRKSISLDQASPSREVAPEIKISDESMNTTHFSIVDADGMAVSNTYTLEESYGSRIVVKNAGFLLNNEMGDFNWRPGITTEKGRIGTAPNEVAPGKRMLSSQTPIIITKDGQLFLVTGSPGGRTITNTVLNVVVNVIDYEMEIQAAVEAPRIHHQWFPDEVKIEKISLFPELLKGLESRKQGIDKRLHTQGDAHSILIDLKTGLRKAGVDKRLDGKGLAQ